MTFLRPFFPRPREIAACTFDLGEKRQAPIMDFFRALKTNSGSRALKARTCEDTHNRMFHHLGHITFFFLRMILPLSSSPQSCDDHMYMDRIAK